VKSDADDLVVRDLEPGDLHWVTRIERRSFSDPWPKHCFLITIMGGNICWGLFAGGNLIGYLIAMPDRDRIHLANLVIDHPYRRRGLGRMLMQKLYETARLRRWQCITLEVRSSNEAAIAFYEAEGFTQMAVESGYYQGREDALIFNRLIS